MNLQRMNERKIKTTTKLSKTTSNEFKSKAKIILLRLNWYVTHIQWNRTKTYSYKSLDQWKTKDKNNEKPSKRKHNSNSLATITRHGHFWIGAEIKATKMHTYIFNANLFQWIFRLLHDWKVVEGNCAHRQRSTRLTCK